MRVLLTGASGFVGPHVQRVLTEAGHDVWSTDRQPLPGASQHVVCDLADADATRNLVRHAAPEGIVHLASLASVGESFEQPRQTLLNNLAVACSVFEAVRHEAPKARLLCIGSAEQYGIVPPEDLPLREDQPQRPASPYAVAKVAQEHLALQYQRSWKLDVVLTRSFNHSGPGQSNRFVLPAFAEQIALCEHGEHDAVLQVGNLDAERDFLDVRDVARAYVALLEKGHSGVCYNVCRGETHRISDLVQGLLERARVPMSWQQDPDRMRPSDLPVLQGSADRLQQHTGWSPDIAMNRTLDDILDDWRERVAQQHDARSKGHERS
jgi:GDP-4-dehydro-6-deoxy-D-mannose reductase